jgi:hypothetical protein
MKRASSCCRSSGLPLSTFSALGARNLGVDFRNLRHDQLVAETITEPKPALQLSAELVQLLDALPPFDHLTHDAQMKPAGRARGRNIRALK